MGKSDVHFSLTNQQHVAQLERVLNIILRWKRTLWDIHRQRIDRVPILEDIADKMLQVLNSPALQAALVKRGLKRTEGYSWERAALETLAVFRKAA